MNPEAMKRLLHHLKLWSDRYQILFEQKNLTVSARPKRIIITSNYSIENCLKGDREEIPQAEAEDLRAI